MSKKNQPEPVEETALSVFTDFLVQSKPEERTRMAHDQVVRDIEWRKENPKSDFPHDPRESALRSTDEYRVKMIEMTLGGRLLPFLEKTMDVAMDSDDAKTMASVLKSMVEMTKKGEGKGLFHFNLNQMINGNANTGRPNTDGFEDLKY